MNEIGSAGTLAAAGLATAGQYLQSRVLDLFMLPFGSALATLIFAVGAVALFYRVALFGDLRAGLLLLFGAMTFSTAIFIRIESCGVKWELGARDHQGRIVSDTLRGIYGFVPDAPDEKIKTFQVSWLFALLDTISTGIVQTATRIIGVASSSSDLKFLARTSNYQQLFGLGITDGKMQQFVHTVLFENCAEWISLHQASIDPAQSARAEIIELELNKWIGKTVISSADRNYPLVKELYEAGYFGQSTEVLPLHLSCQDLWMMAYTALKAQAYSQSVEIIADRLPEGITPDEVLRQAALKFGADDTEDTEDMSRMMNAISARMLMSSFRELYPAFTRANRLPSIRRPFDEGTESESSRYRDSWQLRQQSIDDADYSQGEYFGYLAALPYVQGILLFFLALSYPVFALMLLSPTRMTSFLVWFGLWFWVKLWDFGFAVVMKIDDLLYYLLPRGPSIADASVSDPGAVFRAVLTADPTYSITVYWDIMAMLMGSVPVVTAMMTWVGGSIVMYQVRGAISGFAGDRMAGQLRQSGVEYRRNVEPRSREILPQQWRPELPRPQAPTDNTETKPNTQSGNSPGAGQGVG